MKSLAFILSILFFLNPMKSYSLPIEFDDPNYMGKGKMNGNMVVLELPKDLVQSWLPEGLILADQDWTEEGFYPVAVMLMEQQEVFFGYPNQTDSPHNYDLGQYLETIVWAPFIKIDPQLHPNLDTKTIYSHMIQLHLNSQEGLDFGIDYYGINKFLATMERNLVSEGFISSTHDYSISSLSGTPELSMTYKTHLLRTFSFGNVGFLFKLKGALSRPFIFKHPEQDDIICAEVKWSFFRAKLMASSFNLEISEDFLPGLEALSLSSEDEESTYKSLGSYSIKIPWKFSGPQTCQ